MIISYKDTLNIGDYGENFLDYDISEYISDIISYISDANIDVYDYNLWEWAKNNGSWIDDAILNGFYNIDPMTFDLMDLFKAGQYIQIHDTLYHDIDDIIAYRILEEVQHDFINKQRLVEVIEDNCYNIDTDRSIEYYINIVRDTMEDYPLLEIHLLTGTVWTKSIMVEGTTYDDLLELIDQYYLDNGDLPVPMYTIDDLLEGESFRSQDEEWDYIDGLEMLPINGGEFYINGISHIEEVI